MITRLSEVKGKWILWKSFVKDLFTLKHGKENGNVLIKAIDYDISVQISQTPTRLATLKSHLKQLNKRGKWDDNTFKKTWSQTARIARQHRLTLIMFYYFYQQYTPLEQHII